MSVPVLRNQMTPQIFDPRVVIFRNILTPDGCNDTEWPGVNLFRGSKYFVTSACDRQRQTLDCSICGAMFYVLKTKRHPVDLHFSEIKRLNILRENIIAVCEHFRSLVSVINYTNTSEIRLFGFISDAANFIVLTITAMQSPWSSLLNLWQVTDRYSLSVILGLCVLSLRIKTIYFAVLKQRFLYKQ